MSLNSQQNVFPHLVCTFRDFLREEETSEERLPIAVEMEMWSLIQA